MNNGKDSRQPDRYDEIYVPIDFDNFVPLLGINFEPPSSRDKFTQTTQHSITSSKAVQTSSKENLAAATTKRNTVSTQTVCTKRDKDESLSDICRSDSLDSDSAVVPTYTTQTIDAEASCDDQYYSDIPGVEDDSAGSFPEFYTSQFMHPYSTLQSHQPVSSMQLQTPTEDTLLNMLDLQSSELKPVDPVSSTASVEIDVDNEGASDLDEDCSDMPELEPLDGQSSENQPDKSKGTLEPFFACKVKDLQDSPTQDTYLGDQFPSLLDTIDLSIKSQITTADKSTSDESAVDYKTIASSFGVDKRFEQKDDTTPDTLTPLTSDEDSEFASLKGVVGSESPKRLDSPDTLIPSDSEKDSSSDQEEILLIEASKPVEEETDYSQRFKQLNPIKIATPLMIETSSATTVKATTRSRTALFRSPQKATKRSTNVFQRTDDTMEYSVSPKSPKMHESQTSPTVDITVYEKAKFDFFGITLSEAAKVKSKSATSSGRDSPQLRKGDIAAGASTSIEDSRSPSKSEKRHSASEIAEGDSDYESSDVLNELHKISLNAGNSPSPTTQIKRPGTPSPSKTRDPFESAEDYTIKPKPRRLSGAKRALDMDKE